MERAIRASEIANQAANFLKPKASPWLLDLIIPIPPSDTTRAFQPVYELARHIGAKLNLPVREDILNKTKATSELKSIEDEAQRQAILKDAFAVGQGALEGKDVLLLDDLYRSGETLKAATKVLLEKGRAERLCFDYNKNEGKEMKNEQTYLRLLEASGFGAKALRLLLFGMKEYGISADEIFDVSQFDFNRLFPELGKGRLQAASWEALQSVKSLNINALIEKIEAAEINILSPLDPDFPSALESKMQQNTPSFLYCKGQKKLLNKEGVAIVGARNANTKTLQLTQNIAKGLADDNFNIISGFAKGVDSAAHLGALENNGTTTMVLSFGLFELARQKVYEEADWEANALAVSQFDLSEKWRGTNAMARNKLVCALSKAVLVMAAGPEKDNTGKMSGTFDAGRSALAMGLPLFVVSPTAACFEGVAPEGNKALIRLGGIEVSSVNQIINYLRAPEAQANQARLF